MTETKTKIIIALWNCNRIKAKIFEGSKIKTETKIIF